MIKHIEIDEKAIYERIYSMLEPSYTLRYVSYDDALAPETLHSILEKGLEDQFEDVFDDQQRYYAREALNRLIDSIENLSKDQKALFRESPEYDELLLEIESRDDSTAVKDLFLQSRIKARVTLHSNYDCWHPLWEARGLYGKEDALEGMMRMLSLNPAKVKKEAVKQEIDCFGRFPNLKYREGKEIVAYEDFIDILRECPNYGLFSFFGYFDMDALWNSGFKTDGLVIPKGTECTMFNDWNGGGSLAFAKTLRPVSLRELKKRGATLYDRPAVYIDEKFRDALGYSSGEVYGGTLSKEEILVAA